MVSLQSFEHFDVIYLVDKNTDHGQLSSICFFIITSTVLTSRGAFLESPDNLRDR